MRRFLKWTGIVLGALMVLMILFVLLFDWNLLRGPIARKVTEKTGRELLIQGDLKVKLGWPLVRIRAGNVRFANPAWAKEKQMIDAQEIEIGLALPHIFQKEFIVPDVRLSQAEVNLEQSGSKKNWLLDKQNLNDNARVKIIRLILDHARLNYDDAPQHTSIQSELSTRTVPGDANVDFTAQGLYKGLALKAKGTGGPVLGLRDENTPYPLNIDGTVGLTTIRARGTITSLMKFSAMDMQLDLRGASLAQLYPLFGIALPETPPYHTAGRIAHNAKMWRYEKFSGRIGKSDINGTLQVDTGGKRPYLHGDLVSQLLDFADLGPLIGTQARSKSRAKSAAPVAAPTAQGDATSAAPTTASTVNAASATPPTRVLPDAPFHTNRWQSVDADVSLKAKSIHRAQALPVDNLVTRIKMQDSVLTLDPLNFGVAGGSLAGTVLLDGSQDPIRAHLKMQARKLLISKLFPTFDLNKASIGQVNGTFDLTGRGNSVAHMLGSSDGKAALIVADGEVSKLMMEMVGLHIWEILHLKIAGDKSVKINCGIADFNVQHGVMTPNVLLLDTEVTRIDMSGDINLGQETLDLTLVPKTKQTSLIALRTPIYIRGTLSRPKVSLDKTRLALRTLGAAALGAVNPLLALVPLVETGPGMDSQCGKLIREAQGAAHNK